MKITALKGLTNEQERIYQGLMQVGELMGAFYLDAVMVLREECMLQTKVNIVAHCAREIDSGLRAVFSPDKEKAKKEATLSGKDQGHYASILVALGNDNAAVADEWLAIAKQFHGFAHRHEPWLKPRQASVVAALWRRYEKILAILTGSVYAIQDRIGQLIKVQDPTREMLGALPNLIKGRQNEFQFYKNLDKPDWLKPLLLAGAFDLSKIEPQYDREGRQVLIDWLPLRYFANIAAEATIRKEKIITDTINSLKTAVIAGRLFVDDYTMYMAYKSLGALKNYVFDQSDVDFLNSYYSYATQGQFPLHESYLLETLPENYVNDGKKEGLINLLCYCFGFRVAEEKLTGFEDLGIYSQRRVSPNLHTVTHHHVIDGLLKGIIELTGSELLYKLADITTELFEVRSGEMNTIPSIEVSEQTEMYTYDWILNIIQFIRSGAELLPVEELIPFVKAILFKKGDTLQRIAIHLIRLNYKELSHLYWDWISKNRLNGQFNVHELYLLIQQISPDLTIGELQQLIAWVEDMQYESDHYKPEDLERFKIHRIRTYFSAIKVQGKEQIAVMEQRNQHFDALDAWPLQHPEFDTYSTFSRGYDVPIQQNVLENMSVAEQVDYLMNFEKKDDLDTESYGLGLLLNNVIIGAPDKYEAALPELMKLNDFYLQQVTASFGWVVKNGELKNWNALVKQLNDRVFAKGNPNGESRDLEQSLTSFAEMLLQLADHNDKFNFSVNDLDNLIGICVALLSVDFPDQLADIPNRDHISERLNSLWGKAFDTLIGFNRLWANHPARTGTEKIHPAIFSYLEEKLDNTATVSPGFFINIGWHFPYLLTVAPDWCKKNASRLFTPDNYRLGLVVNNLLSPYQQVYKNVLVYLSEEKLNAALVDRKYDDEASINRVCRYALTELNYIDSKAISKEGTLINLILAKEDPGQYKSLITVALQNKEANEPVMLELWANIAARISSGKPGFDNARTLIAGFLMISGVSDASLNLLDDVIGHLQNMPVTYQILSTLYRKFEFAPERIAQTVLKIWEQAKLRVMTTDDLGSVVSKLYAQGHKPIADEICLYVAGQGNYELKAIYDQYQTDEIASKKAPNEKTD